MKLKDFKIEELKWDSDFFGYTVGKLDLQNFDTSKITEFSLNHEFFKLIYIFTDSKNKELESNLEKNGAVFLDRKTEYKINLSEIDIKRIKNEKIKFKFLRNEDLSGELEDLTYEAGKNSRFKLDSKFTNNEFKRLYDIWLARSLNKEIAFDTIGLFLDDKLVAFITLGEKYDGANIGLIAVNPDYQNKGLGSDLLNFCFDYLKNKNYNYLYVTTQGLSEQATNFYERNGFKLLNQTDIYHLWKN